jgi:hypothetical protein
MSIRPVVDSDPLGIIADTEGIRMPLSDWKGIARLGMTYEQVVRLYGNPPKAARHFFRITAKSKSAVKHARLRPTPKVARRSMTRT